MRTIAENFIEVPITTEATTLADNAIAALAAEWPGWSPNDGDLEVIMVEAIAPMAENAANVAAQVPAAVLRRIGTDLYGVVYENGVAARSTVTFTLADTDGHAIPVGTEIVIDDYTFSTLEDAYAAEGESVIAGVPVEAFENGTEMNDLNGSTVEMLSALAAVINVELDSPTSGGVDEEDDTDYLIRLATELQLQAFTLVTTRDFELWALAQPGVGRVLAIGNTARAVAIYATDDSGEPLGASVKAALIADYENYRQVNTTFTVNDPTYTTVDVTYSAKTYPGFVASDVEARIDAALGELLSPAKWGMPEFGDIQTTRWENEPLVRQFVLIDKIGSVEGVRYVESLTITGSAGAASNGDWTLPGVVPLPRPGTITGTVT